MEFKCKYKPLSVLVLVNWHRCVLSQQADLRNCDTLSDICLIVHLWQEYAVYASSAAANIFLLSLYGHLKRGA